MTEHIVVFGGTGFIGEYVVRELENRGDAVMIIDGETPRNVIESKIQKATCIFWLIPPNLALLRSLAPVMQKNPLARLIFSSTLLLYKDSELPASEVSELEPEGEYESAKYAEEEYLREVFVTDPSRLCIARLTNVYGDVKNKGIIAALFNAAMTHKAATVKGDGSTRRDYIHVEDVARLLAGLATAPLQENVSIFNVSTGRAYSINELIEKIGAITTREIPVTYEQPFLEKRTHIGDSTKILSVLRESIRYDLPTGLLKTYDKFKKNTL